ncbi:MarR family winged helix-turn-helix transcriptional regulator [Marinisporobacter balticus]|uniref:DNA-binding MarR family transcriptional regulator n=1 Tax=Marinisporobacter balticus TaxID=2018667 RepID=A0A4R2K994_9FIRM|nr:MarR family transcriptional regulator [Marinisporobacter balticus]TCO68692.1 DNA-binding MarR family transcriptional regulator [Marinisporobacter balticus]
MRDYSELTVMMERCINKYNRTENRQRCYGTDIKLSRVEIHTIDSIGNNEGINVTQLAAIQGVTKGAVSQMIYKLVKKGVVSKSVSPNSDTEVRLELTKDGWSAYEMHKKYHQMTEEKLFLLLKDMPDEIYNELEKLLKEFEKSLDERL